MIKAITNENTPIKQTKKILIYIYMDMKLHLDHVRNYTIWKLMKKPTIKEIRNILNETFILGELEANPYFIYKGGEQEDKDKHKQREPQIYYYKCTEPILLEYDNKTLQYYDIHDNELSNLKVQLKLLLKVPCCRFSTIYNLQIIH